MSTHPHPALPLLADVDQKDAEAGLALLDEYIAAFNAQDATRWSRTLHYPHVRFAGEEVKIWHTPEAYAADNDIRQLAEKTGWARSRWDFRHLVQGNADKLHFALQFTRYDAGNQPQGSYQAFYVLTRQNGRWGVQARSSYAGIIGKNTAF
ncbi:MAG: hypothetical protein LBR88_00395 [Zoogloeaceae bacterium]|jgi:hypothetical protein|nr:hypothetical protein [Zoogloeaceae bacterium]